VERKIIKFEIKAIDEEAGIIEGYAATFNDEPDSYGDIIEPGAFTKTLKEQGGQIVSLFNHNVNEPIGLPTLKEDKRGLFATIQLVRGVQRAEETLLLAKAGVIKRMSIGYETVKQEMEKGYRHLKELKLYDASPVVHAANTNALITAVKQEDTDMDTKAGRVLSAGNLDKLRSAIEALGTTAGALQALLQAAEGDSEPDGKATHNPEETGEAADMESILSKIEAELEGFDSKAAEERIDVLLSKIK